MANVVTSSGASKATSRTTNAQSAVIYDLLSEGPIEGLVDGVASIRLNDNPVANSTNSTLIAPRRSTDVNYNATTGTITDNRASNVFDGLTTADGSRYITIFGAKKRSNNSINAIAGNNIITSSNTSNISFASTDISSTYIKNQPESYIRIDGAGEGGGQLVASIIGYINTSAIQVDPAPVTNASNTAAYLDLVAVISSFSGNTATLTATGQGVSTANTVAIISSPNRPSSQQPVYNYQNFGFAFRTGHGDQEYLPTPAGIGSASVAHSVQNGGIDTTAGTGYPSPSTMGFNFPTDAYTGTALTVTSDQMSIGNPGEIDLIRTTINFPSLISQKETGSIGPGFAEYRITFGYSRDGGATYTDVVKVGRETISSSRSDYHANGHTKSTSSGIIQKRTQQAFNALFEFSVQEHQPFDKYRLKFERISVVNQKENKWQQTNAATIQSIENIILDKLSYPHSAYAAVVIDGEDFQDVPKRSYVIRGLRVKVPTNYFPIDSIDDATGLRRTAAAYTRNVTSGLDAGTNQDWDGNFRGDKSEFPLATDPNHEPVYTNNPVWIFMDLLSNHRYGVGKYLNPDFDFSMIDKYTLYQLAKYCDELVPDGKGGYEPRFTCNLYIQKDDTALKVLQNLSSLLRGMLIWYGGQVTLGSSIQKGAVYTFTKANVLGGAFQYAGTANRFRNNQVAVTWTDPEQGYKQAVEVVEDHDEIARTGKIRRKNITAYGTTSRGQAIRLGKFHLLTERLEKETINFETGFNASMIKPGDVIDVQDPDLNDVVCSGRVTTSSSSNTTFIKTDRDITSFLDGTNTFKLHLIYPNGGCYLSQPSATINGVTYYQGDLVLYDEDGASIDTQAKASNLLDDSGNIVQNIWSDDVRIETQTVDYANTTSTGIKVTSAFTSAPNGEVIFTVSGENASGADVTGSFKQYLVMGIKQNPKEMTYNISASEYHIEKFDEVDRGWVIPTLPEIARTPVRTEDVPVPKSLTARMVLGDATGGDANSNSTESNAGSYSLLIQWNHPITTRTDKDGNTIQDVYEHLAGYNIQHNILTENQDRSVGDFTTEKIRTTSKTEWVIRNVQPQDEIIIRVQTVNVNDYTSGWIQRKIDFSSKSLGPFTTDLIGGGLNGGISRGGILSTVVNIESSNGLVTFANSTYTFVPPGGADPIIVTSGNTNFTQQAFSSLADGDTAYLLYDYDANLARGTTKTDPLRAIVLANDTTAADPSSNAVYNYTFMARLGESSNDLVAANGTITTTAEEPDVTGSSTTFETDYQVGDVIALGDAGANRFMANVMYITSNTALTLDRSVPQAYSGANVFRQGLTIDVSTDAIIGEVKNSSGTFSYTPFTNKLKVDTSDEIGGNTITSTQLSGNSVGSVHIEANSIGTAQIAGNAITSAEISANSIGSAAIVAGSINNSHMSANSIGSAQVIAGSIGESEIAANSIGSVAIQANSIGESQIAANSIGSVAISANAIGESEIASNSIGTVAIQANSITSAQLTASAVAAFTVSANSITAVELAANSVGSVALAANSVNTIEIAGNSITSAKLAVGSVTGTIIASGGVGTTQLATGAVTGIIIANGAVDTSQLANGAVEEAKIAANAVTNAKLAALAVDTAQIVGSAITAALLAANAVTNEKIAANAVDTVEIKSNAIGIAQLQANSVDTAQIRANSIAIGMIQANAVDTAQIAANAVEVAQIASNAVDTAQIKANSVTAAIIQTDAINTNHIKANTITAVAILSGEINTNHIAANAITSVVIASNAVETNMIKADQITNAKIAVGAVDTNEIAANAITNAKIEAGAVNNASIAAGAITNAKIAADTINNAQIQAGAVNNAKIAADTINTAQIKALAITNAKIAADTINTAQIKADAVTNAKIAANAITNAEILSNTITNANISASAAIDFAKITGVSINTAQISANAITNAKISSSDALTLTIDGGTTGGWAISANQLTSASVAGGGDGSFTTTGIRIGSSTGGFISGKQFYIDSSGNANFQGTLVGANVVISGTLTTANIQLASTGANVSGTSIGQYTYTNALNYRLIGTIGTGAGVYVGNVVGIGPGGTNHVKSIHFHVSDNTMNTSTVNADVALATNGTASGSFDMRLQTNIDNLIPESRLYASGASVRTHFSLPVTFKYEGTGTVKLYMYAQADSGPDYPGYIDYRFVKLGTTDPVFNFSNLTGAALSTTYYANTQVTGGFQGTKTASISGGSASFAIDTGSGQGSFGTANQQVSNGSYINVQMTSASTNLTSVSTTVDVGGVSKNWVITTGGTTGGGTGTGGGGGGGTGGTGGPPVEEVSFLYGTELTLSDGTKRAVQDIAPGDVLKAFSDSVLNDPTATSGTLANATFATAVVESVKVGGVTSFYRINERVHVTAPHKFLILRNNTYSWIQAQNLQVNDYMVTSGLSLEKIQTIQIFNNNALVYTFDTESLDTYIAEDVVVYDAEI